MKKIFLLSILLFQMTFMFGQKIFSENSEQILYKTEWSQWIKLNEDISVKTSLTAYNKEEEMYLWDIRWLSKSDPVYFEWKSDGEFIWYQSDSSSKIGIETEDGFCKHIIKSGKNGENDFADRTYTTKKELLLKVRNVCYDLKNWDSEPNCTLVTNNNIFIKVNNVSSINNNQITYQNEQRTSNSTSQPTKLQKQANAVSKISDLFSTLTNEKQKEIDRQKRLREYERQDREKELEKVRIQERENLERIKKENEIKAPISNLELINLINNNQKKEITNYFINQGFVFKYDDVDEIVFEGFSLNYSFLNFNKKKILVSVNTEKSSEIIHILQKLSSLKEHISFFSKDSDKLLKSFYITIEKDNKTLSNGKEDDYSFILKTATNLYSISSNKSVFVDIATIKKMNIDERRDYLLKISREPLKEQNLNALNDFMSALGYKFIQESKTEEVTPNKVYYYKQNVFHLSVKIFDGGKDNKGYMFVFESIAKRREFFSKYINLGGWGYFNDNPVYVILKNPE